MVTQSNGRSKMPPVVQSTRDWFEYGGGQSGGTHIKQADAALFPGVDDPMLALLLKSRISPEIERDIAWLLSEAAVDGEISLSELGIKEASIPTTFAVLKVGISYASQGKARTELVEVLRGMARPLSRLGRMAGRRNGYDGGDFE